MKKKIRVLVPSLILEVLEKDCDFFGVSKENLCNQILLKFSLKFRSNYQKELAFDEKEYLQFNLNKDNQRYYSQLLAELKNINDSDLIREIFSNYAVLCPCLRELFLFREKIAFLDNASKEFRVLKIDTRFENIEGRVEKIFRDKESGYLKINIEKKEFYMSQIRIIN